MLEVEWRRKAKEKREEQKRRLAAPCSPPTLPMPSMHLQIPMQGLTC